jgi:hypothetical protein
MHVLLLTDSYPNAYLQGQGSFVRDQALCLASHGMQVGVIAIIPISWSNLLKTGFGGLGGTGKADSGENTVRNLLPGYTTGADDFWRFFNDNPSRLDKYGIRDLKKELGIIDPTDKRIPAGAVIVIGPDYFRETSPSSKAAIYGDINVKMPNGDFLNPRSMGNWMTTTDWKANPNFVRGIYVPK